MKKSILGLLAFFVTPFIASAASVTSIGTLIATLADIITALIPFIIGLAVLYFIWGVFQFVASAGDEEARGAGRDKMIYGVIGLFVMVSVWGLVAIVKGTFGTTNTTPTDIPVGPTIDTTNI